MSCLNVLTPFFFVFQEPGDRAQSLGVVSVEAEETELHHTNRETGAMRDIPLSTHEEPVPLDYEGNSQVETNIQSQTSSNPRLEGREPPASTTYVTLNTISSAVEHDIPMPVTADPNVVDPTSPDIPSHPTASIPEAPDVQPQTQRQTPDDDLFTPADGSTAVTPARFPENFYSQILDELAHVFSRTPIVSSTPVEELVPVSNSNLLLDIGLVIDEAVEHIRPVQLPTIGAEATYISGSHSSDPIPMPSSPPPRDPPVSMHVALTRKPTDPILVSDPYPYSLSTPGVSLMDATEEDTELDNSMSSNSTLEKDLEDKDTCSLDDTDALELQYPPEPEVLAELNIRAAAEGQEMSKIVDNVVDADADGDGDFDPDFVVTRLSQPHTEIQPVVDPPTSGSTVAVGPISGVEKDDIGSGNILPT